MDILCVGQLATDILVKPVDSVDFNVDTKRVEQISVKNGGDALNTAINLAKLGNKVCFAGKVGDDSFGDFLLKTIKSCNIDSKGLKIEKGASSPSVIVLINAKGERTFLYYGGTNDRFEYEDIDTSLIDECRVVHVGGTYTLPKFDGEGTARLFQLAQSKSKITSMDVSSDTTGKWLSIIKPCLKYLNFFMPSYNEAKSITGEETPEAIANFLLNEGVGTVVVKLGRDGCYVNNQDESFYFPAYDVKVVDTTGAGDSFVAGFLTGILKKWDLQKCTKFASAVSAHCIQYLGSTTGIPGFEAVEEFIRRQEK